MLTASLVYASHLRMSVRQWYGKRALGDNLHSTHASINAAVGVMTSMEDKHIALGLNVKDCPVRVVYWMR